MKIAVVSGASSGIGRELVKIIDKNCPMIDEIWVIARRKERLERLQFQIHHPLRILPLDLSKEENLLRLKNFMDRKKPHIYVLAASAGFGKYGPNISQKFQDASGMIDLNVRALTGLTQMALPYMAKGSRILLMSSSAAFVPQPGFSIYAATKAYVLSYGLSLRQEMKKRGVFVTTVCPGPVKTEFFDHCGTGETLSAFKLFFMAQPDKVARQAWRDAMKKKELSVYGPAMKIFRIMTRTIPQQWLIKGMGLVL